MIRQYIKRILLKVIKCYPFYYHSAEQVRRRQIYEMIMNGRLNDKEKRRYKFFFIDSVLILRSMETLLFRETERGGYRWNSLEWQWESIGKEQFDFFKDGNGIMGQLSRQKN